MPDALRSAHPEVTVIAHDDRFPQDADDEAWLRAAGTNGWVALTKDERIRRKPGAQRAISGSGTRCFCLHPTTGMRAEQMAEVLSKHMPKLLRIAAAERRGGFVKTIDRWGRIRHLYP